MTWTRLEPDFAEHPKILAAGPIAELLHIHGLLYCNRHLTDGFIPTKAVQYLLHGPHRRAVERLVELGIWVSAEGGYQVHDFLEYQPSKAEVLALKEERAKAGRLGALARARAIAKQARNQTPPDSTANTLANASDSAANATATALTDPSRSVPGSLEPRLGDNAMSVGTGVKTPTNGAGEHPWEEHVAKARIHAKADS